jgi:hypothetical protein
MFNKQIPWKEPGGECHKSIICKIIEKITQRFFLDVSLCVRNQLDPFLFIGTTGAKLVSAKTV